MLLGCWFEAIPKYLIKSTFCGNLETLLLAFVISEFGTMSNGVEDVIIESNQHLE